MSHLGRAFNAVVRHERRTQLVQWGLFLATIFVGSFMLMAGARASERAAHLATEVVDVAATRERLAARSLGLPTGRGDPLADAVARAEQLRPQLEAELGPDGSADLDDLLEGLQVIDALQEGLDASDASALGQTAVPYFEASRTVSAAADDLVRELAGRSATAAHITMLVVIGGSVMLVAVVTWAFALLGGSRRRAEVMAARTERAEELERLKSEFIALASHELRTPLTGMIGFSHLLIEKSGLSADARAWSQHIHEESLRLNHVVDQLLLAGELDAGTLDLDIAPVDMEALIADAIAQVDEDASSGRFRVSGTPSVEALADQKHLTTVVASLLSNALKYGSSSESVQVTWSAPGDEVVLSVRDHGSGLSSEQASRLFDRFGRADARGNRQVRGLGMGLFVARRLVESMGGSISVAADEGGATFTLRLPAASNAAGRAAA
ncbi:MAG: HAMP domain-containing sensor histidine kinase [Dehalococcoidia bacterium]